MMMIMMLLIMIIKMIVMTNQSCQVIKCIAFIIDQTHPDDRHDFYDVHEDDHDVDGMMLLITIIKMIVITNQ